MIRPEPQSPPPGTSEPTSTGPLPRPALTLQEFIRSGPEAWTLRRLWRALPVEAKRRGVESILASPDPEWAPLRMALQAELARRGGYRKDTLKAMSVDEVARMAPSISARRLPDPEAFFRTLLMRGRRPLLSDYLDALGLAHDEGRLEGEGPWRVEASTAREAADHLARRHPPDDVATYFIVLTQVQPGLAPGLDDWMVEWVADRSFLTEGPADPAGASRVQGEPSRLGLGTDPDAPAPEVVLDARTETRADPQETSGTPGFPFSPLDRTLIRAAVDAAQKIDGAPRRAEVEDMVEEVIALNSSRHRSFFHRGFIDVLWDVEYRDSLPAENQARRDWYLAGWVQGLARREDVERIADLHDREPRLAGLPDAESEPGAIVAPHLFMALCRVGRHAEAVGTLGPHFLRRHPLLLPPILDEATMLLRAEDAETARPLLDRLAHVMELMEAEGESTSERFFLECRRRRAHCYRQLGDVGTARALLTGLLPEERDPRRRAMVLADLGLLDSGFRSLSDVRIGRTEAEIRDLSDGLMQGAPRFREALAAADPPTGHGAWPLGVLALGRGDWEEARKLLGTALSGFQMRAGGYQRKALLARVKIALGVAIAQTVEYTRLPRAADLLMEGIAGGGEMPLIFLVDVVAALEEHDEELAPPFLERLTQRGGDEVLDTVLETESATRSPSVVRALLTRAKQEERPRAARAEDLRRALRLLLDSSFPRGRAPWADPAGILDRLELWARVDGVGREAFLELLETPELLDPVWSEEDVRWAAIPILEAEGRLDEARELLRAEFYEALAGSRRGGLEVEQAQAILSQIRGYNVRAEWISDLTGYLKAYRQESGGSEEPLPETHPHQRARVLVVGGDERNSDLEERVRRRLASTGEPIEIEHIRPGWSGNWAPALERSLAGAQRADAVVILRLVRTEFGRALRAELDRPWVHCPGFGTQTVTRMVRQAARWGVRQRRTRELEGC